MKKTFLLLVALLMGSMTDVMARVNYVPLYIVDPNPDVTTTRKARSVPMFITQNEYTLLLPELEDQMTFKLFKDEECVYEASCQPTMSLPTTLVGDYEVRLCAATYYYHGYLTLEKEDGNNIPTETENWENITLLASNTSQEEILDRMMRLHVVEYTTKNALPEEDLLYLSEMEREEFIHKWESDPSLGQRRIGFLISELLEILPQVVVTMQNGSYAVTYDDIIPVLLCCIQELKYQLDSRIEAIVDAMMSRGSTYTEVSAVRSAIGNTLLSAAPTSVNEPAVVRYLLTSETNNAHIAVTDMSGRVVMRVPVSPSDTSVSIDSRLLGEGVFLCTLYANGGIVGTKRLVKTK